MVDAKTFHLFHLFHNKLVVAKVLKIDLLRGKIIYIIIIKYIIFYKLPLKSPKNACQSNQFVMKRLKRLKQN